MTEFIQVQITFPTKESAIQVAETLVTERLAACAQIIAGKIRSTYIWNGKLETGNEILLLAKTRSTLFENLVDAVRRKHPYVCPQIIALPIVNINDDYLVWMNEQLKN
jgi:periplasmic divalent cation tolerance protein